MLLADFLFLLQWLPERSAQGQDSILTMNSVNNSTHFLRVKAGMQIAGGLGQSSKMTPEPKTQDVGLSQPVNTFITLCQALR